MSLAGLRRSDWLIAAGAIALLVVMFLPWWGASYTGSAPLGASSIHVGVSASVSGWEWLTAQRWLWLLAIAVALATVVLDAATREIELPLSPKPVVAALGALTTGFILYRIIDHPSGGAVGAAQNYTYGIEYGIWLGLVAAAAIMLGGYVGMQDEEASLEEQDGQAGAGAGALPASAPAGRAIAPSAFAATSTTPAAPPAMVPSQAAYPALESFKAASDAVKAREAAGGPTAPDAPGAPAEPHA